MKDEIRCAVEFREDTDRTGPGRLVGTVLTYGQRAKDRAEVFEKDSLSWPSDGVVLNRQHARGAPIMRVIPELRGDALVIDHGTTGHELGPGRGDGDPVGSDAWLVRVVFKRSVKHSWAACGVSSRPR